MKYCIGLCTLVGFIMVASLFAAEFEPNLEKSLFEASDSENFSVIIQLYSPIDIRILDADLHDRRAPLAERHREVVTTLKYNAAETQGPILAELAAMKDQGRVVGYKSWWVANLVVVYGKAEAILDLAKLPSVKSIGPNFTAELIEPVQRGPVRDENINSLDSHVRTLGQRATGADRVNSELGIDGEGTIVAGVDTGVDGTHPALQGRWRGNFAPTAECWLDLIGGRPIPVDFGQHGTHTMGTMCGREIDGNDTITVGAAPKARWIATNPIDQGVSEQFTQDIFDAFEWLTDPDGNENTIEDLPDAIQNSWGVTSGHVGMHCYNNWNEVILNCEAAGPIITWSAGNESTSGLRSPATYEINPYQVFAVGAVDATHDTIPPFPCADFSSRGPSLCDPDPQAIKPEITAPGVDVYSTVPGGGYQSINWSGTSMSGPHVAGVIALMRQACPDCDYITIKQALMATAIDSGYPPAGEDNAFGAGFLNAYDAVLMVASLGRVDGWVTTSGGQPLAGVRCQPLPSERFRLTDSTGYYNVSAEEGTYTMRFTKFGYETITIPGVETVEGETTHVNITMPQAAAGVLAAQVILQSNIGVQGAKVKIEETPIDTITTDVNGEFVQALPATAYSIHVQYTINLEPPVLVETDTTIIVAAGDTTHAVITLFVSMVEPTDPDAYGYRAYDRYDRDLPAPFDWVELNPEGGFPGTEFFFANGDSALFMPTPFPIAFYGSERDTLTVNPNGWMFPGEQHGSARTNLQIPYNAQAYPPGIIAAFWDDLRNAQHLGAQSFYWYDIENGRWIFEFINHQIEGSGNSISNWQVHFYDPAFHPTITGDCEMLFLYGIMRNVRGCTVGLDNPNANSGVSVLFNSTLNPASWPIEDGAAIRFTTGHPTATGQLTATATLYPPLTEIPGAMLHAGGRHISPTSGTTTFTDNAVAAGMVSGMFDYEGYDIWRGRTTLNPGGSANLSIQSWRLDPPRYLGGWQLSGYVHLSWTRPECTDSANPPYPLYYSLYVNGNLRADMLSDTTYLDGPYTNGQQPTYTVVTHYRYRDSEPSAPYTVLIDLPVDEPITSLPTEFALYQNYPNPFNPLTTIRMDVPDATQIRLDVFDVNGRLVRTLHDGMLSAGRYSFSWDSRDNDGHSVATGLYLCRLSSTRFTSTQKMLLVK